MRVLAASRCCFFPLGETASGCPRQGSNFLLLAQEKVTKEKGTLLVGRPRADCSALLGLCSSRRTRYAPCRRCAQTTARSQMWRRAHARCCKALRCSTTHQGDPRAIRRPLRGHSIHASLRIGEAKPAHRAERSEAGWCCLPLRTRRLGSLLCPLSCRYKKVGRPPARTPGAASRSAETLRQEAQGSARTASGAPPEQHDR